MSLLKGLPVLLVFLAALAVNLAYFFPSVFGVAILLFWLPLVMRRLTFAKGFVWGLLVFGPHFVWLAVLLATKSHAPMSLALAGYVGVTIYFALTGGILFWFAGKGAVALRAMVRYASAMRSHSPRAGYYKDAAIFSLIAVFYYYFIENYSLFIFGRCEGYPFLNPLIPLAEWRPVIWLVAKVGALVRWVMFSGALILNPGSPSDVRLVYMAPVSGVQDHAVEVGQCVYHALAVRNLGVLATGSKPLIIVTPESFYPFSLNVRPEQLALWSSVIPDDAYLIVGSQMLIGRKFYQAAYLTQKGLIRNYYVKHHCMPFVEKIPKLWKRIAPLRELFLQNADEFSRGKMSLEQGLFDVGTNIRLIPQICSEFFFTVSAHQVWQVCQAQGNNKTALLLLLNDSWFVDYFQRMLKAMATLKAAYFGIPVIYVGHRECRWLDGGE